MVEKGAWVKEARRGFESAGGFRAWSVADMLSSRLFELSSI